MVKLYKLTKKETGLKVAAVTATEGLEPGETAYLAEATNADIVRYVRAILRGEHPTTVLYVALPQHLSRIYQDNPQAAGGVFVGKSMIAEILDRDPTVYKPADLHWYAPDPNEFEWFTPAEVASLTGTAESGWRNKAAAGEIPGAIKKGKQWLIPRATLRAMHVKV